MTDLPPPDDATRAQIDAANPAGSVWLAANAGSGKTRVLIDRVAWLLLSGTRPERILCLTFTKAAAGEMQNRLFERLGNWAMMSDDKLRGEITRLGAARGTIPTDRLRRARTLFAQAIETPGGLKIQTIHAFCASLLRRFPLEAGVSPAYTEMDEIATARLQAEVLDDMASDARLRRLVDAMAAQLTDAEPSAFLADVARHRGAFDGALTTDDLKAALGIEDESPEAVRDATVTADDLDLIEMVRDAAADVATTTMIALTDRLSEALRGDPARRFDALGTALLTGDGDVRARLVTKPVVAKIGEGAADDLRDLAERVADALPRIAAFGALAKTEALHAFAPAFAAEVEGRKAARGWLDFDDLIDRTRRLLGRSDMAQWVLYKLDGGIDHILVDEAQDTSPGQWEVIERLAEEFDAGAGARGDVTRTIFIVGDRKQSIYAFQGADLDAFDRMRTVFADKTRETDTPLRDHALRHSFRSSPVILDLVDAVFAESGGVGDAPQHIAFHPDMPGRVDLWPVTEPADGPDTSDRQWFKPLDLPTSADAEVILAHRIARTIKTMIEDGTPIGHGEKRRAVTAGDILILVQRRSSLFHHIVRACKAADLDLAGADRLGLLDDMAVRDLIATLTWAATPDDDLSLATVLRSPLANVSEAELFALAHPRKAGLWEALRTSDLDPGARDMLTDILRIADVLRPYEILQRILVRHDGRRRLIARLGAEVTEAIDALLSQALAYEQLETPSLTGFLGWLASADVELKRQAGAGSIRVMTVHGAKGLESAVVFLPETMKRKVRTPSGVQRLPDGTPVWMPSAAHHAPATRDLVEATQAADAAERDRLLYVAMTRAESWLIVGAAGNVGEAPDESWYNRIRAAMEDCKAAPPPGEAGGLTLRAGDWTPLPMGAAVPDKGPLALPVWAKEQVPLPTKAATRIAPSALPGAKTLPGDVPADGTDAMARGTAIHALLEHLPTLPRAAWSDRAAAIVAAATELAPDQVDDVFAEARGVLEAPDLQHLFADGTLAEVPFALPGTETQPAIFGTMDRVVITPESVLVVDFKSNAVLPQHPENTPEGVLRQMAAYRLAAGAIWPERRIDLAILWTKGPVLMGLPHELVTDLAPAIDPLVRPA